MADWLSSLGGLADHLMNAVKPETWRELEARVATFAATEAQRERLPDEALSAISIEHERDHSDGHALPREGCNGCRMLAYGWSLRDRLAAAERERDEARTERDHALAMEDRSHQLRNQARDWCERLRHCVARLAALRSKTMSAAQCEVYGIPFTTEVADANTAYAETWRAIDALFEERALAAPAPAPGRPPGEEP